MGYLADITFPFPSGAQDDDVIVVVGRTNATVTITDWLAGPGGASVGETGANGDRGRLWWWRLNPGWIPNDVRVRAQIVVDGAPFDFAASMFLLRNVQTDVVDAIGVSQGAIAWDTILTTTRKALLLSMAEAGSPYSISPSPTGVLNRHSHGSQDTVWAENDTADGGTYDLVHSGPPSDGYIYAWAIAGFPGEIIPSGSASITGTGTITAAGGNRIVRGSAALSATGTVAVGGYPKVAGAAVVAGVGTITVTGTVPSTVGSGDAAITATGTITAGGVARMAGGAVVAGTATITAVGGNRTVSGAASISATGVVTAGGFPKLAGQVLVVGSGTITVVGGAAQQGTGNAAISATGVLDASGYPRVPGGAVLTATATLSASGLARVSGQVAVVGAGTITAVGGAAVVEAALWNGTRWVSGAELHNGVGWRPAEVWNGSRWIAI